MLLLSLTYLTFELHSMNLLHVNDILYSMKKLYLRAWVVNSFGHKYVS